MLIKLLNEDAQWELWDGITHVVEHKVKFRIKEGESEGVPDTLQVQAKQGHWYSPPNNSVVLIDAENPSSSRLIAKEEVNGTLLQADMRDGSVRDFYFIKQGYLLSDDGKTIESYNNRPTAPFRY